MFVKVMCIVFFKQFSRPKCIKSKLYFLLFLTLCDLGSWKIHLKIFLITKET